MSEHESEKVTEFEWKTTILCEKKNVKNECIFNYFLIMYARWAYELEEHERACVCARAHLQCR